MSSPSLEVVKLKLGNSGGKTIEGIRELEVHLPSGIPFLLIPPLCPNQTLFLVGSLHKAA